MLFITAENLKPGMILAMDLTVYNNYNFKTLLLSKGQPLSDVYISKIISNNISGAYVKNEETCNKFSYKSIEYEFEAAVLTRIKDVFYKYKLNSGKFDARLLRQISILADDLIEEIIYNKTLWYNTLEFSNSHDYVFQHCLNVAILSISVGNSLQLSAHKLHELAVAALLHDISMLMIPEEILYKQEPLSEDEFKIVKMHPLTAVNELKSLVSNDILMGISGHHEHVDGTGYPHGLSNGQIHLFGKILAVCDVYQALNTKFVYRDTWKPSKIVNYLLENINSKLDYKITRQFLKDIIVYPVGSYVKLNNGKNAIIVKNNSGSCLRPVVRPISSRDNFQEDINLIDAENQDIEITEKGHTFQYIVSACLCGEKTRYDGKVSVSEKIKKLVDEGKALMVCPEVDAGLKTPRLPCEIKNGRVINISSDDKTDYFVNGAIKTLKTAQKYGIKKAILKEKSPSCGSSCIYDGTFNKKLIPGEGITTRLLRLNGIEVISDEEYEERV